MRVNWLIIFLEVSSRKEATPQVDKKMSACVYFRPHINIYYSPVYDRFWLVKLGATWLCVRGNVKVEWTLLRASTAKTRFPPGINLWKEGRWSEGKQCFECNILLLPAPVTSLIRVSQPSWLVISVVRGEIIIANSDNFTYTNIIHTSVLP